MLDYLYGWNPQIQEEFERLLSTVTSLPCFVQYQPLDELVSRDTDVPGGSVPGCLSAESPLLNLGSTVIASSYLPQLAAFYLGVPITLADLGDYLGKVFFEAFFEEIWKRIRLRSLPVGFLTFIATETYTKLANPEFYRAAHEFPTMTQRLRGIGLSTVMHVVVQRLPMDYSTLCHMVWNLFWYHVATRELALSPQFDPSTVLPHNPGGLMLALFTSTSK